MHLFKIRVYGVKKRSELYAVESAICDDFLGGTKGLKSSKSGIGPGFVDLSGEFRLEIESDLSTSDILEVLSKIRLSVYRAAQRFVQIDIEMYPISGGMVYSGSELEFANIKKNGLLDVDLGDMEELDYE